MKASIDATAMRRINKTLVFKKIYEQPFISRVDIAREQKLNKATVTSLVDELISEELVKEVGYGESRGGRKPVLLSVNQQGGYAIGLNVQITHIQAILCNLSGEIIYEHQRPLALATSQTDHLIDCLEDEVHHLVKHTQETPYGVIGIGIALPGMVNSKSGYVHYLPNLEIRDWNIKETLYQRLSIPIFIDNDGNCGALAEYRRNLVHHLAYVHVGIGVGVGIISKGEPCRGRNGLAGEFGHMTISAMGIQCSCGSYGCWEQYASERALLRYVDESEKTRGNALPGPDFVQQAIALARQGNETYINAIKMIGQYLGIGLANVANALNPEVIYIGGTLACAHDLFAAELHKNFVQRVLAPNRSVSIQFSESHNTVVMGAVSLPLSALFLTDQDSILHR